MLNGVPRDFIVHQRGLQQGDSLSPMLFILLMDILLQLVQKALEDGHLQPLSSCQLRHRISLYVDDVVMFLKSNATDINLVLDMLRLFRRASSLHTNVQKSSVVPPQCDSQTIATAKELLPCDFVDFPCRYLGLHLSIKKLTRSHIQSVIDRVDSSLLG
jgi:hypothetical protein